MHGTHHLFKSGLFSVFICLFLSFVFSGSLKAFDSILITENTEQLNLSSMAYYLEDHDGMLNVSDLQKPEYQSRFRQLTSEIINAGVTRSVIWLAFDLKYLSYFGEDLGLWLLEVRHPSLDLVTLYYQDEIGDFQAIHSGDKYPFGFRSVAHPSFLFPVELSSGDTRLFYFRIETSGSMQLPVTLWTPLAYLEYTALDKTLSGIFLGIILVMLIYHFAQFLFVRDYCYLFFTAYAASFLLYHLTISGIGMATLWPGFPQLNSAAPFFMCSAGVLAALFARSFMGLDERSPRLDGLLLMVALFGLLVMPASLLIHYGIAARLVIWQGMLVLPVVMMSGLYSWLFKKDRAALLFTLAFSSVLAGGLVYGLMSSGHLANNLFTSNAVLMGQAIQAVLLGLALSKRSWQASEQEVLAEKANIRQLKKSNERLMNSNYLNQDILQSVSHQLSKPLRRIVKALDLFADADNSDNRAALLEEASNNSKETRHLIRSLLAKEEFQARFLNLVETPFHLRRQLEILEDRFRPQALRKKLDFSVDIDDSVPFVLYGDFRKLMKALSYLVDNAILYTSEGYVKILASAQQAPEAGKCIVSLRVEDSGIGIDAKYQEKVYQVFEQVDGENTKERFGIGLAACRYIANIMDGSVNHYPAETSGTCFEFEVTLSKYDQ